ncbi:MAG: TolC family protein [Bdellovibrionales bacterium]|nr:TolC family protein [Bdellovibrionales bacterium]
MIYSIAFCRVIRIRITAAVTALILACSHSASADSRVLTLQQALSRATQQHPSILSYQHRLKSAESAREQANSLPNPELDLEIENFAGQANGLREAETTVSILQPIELGGERKARTSLALINRDIIAQEALVAKLAIKAHTKLAFTKLLYFQLLADLTQEQRQMAHFAADRTKRKHEAGAVLLVDKTKAEVTLQNIQLEHQQALAELTVAKQELASMWNGSEQDVGTVSGSLAVDDPSRYLLSANFSKSPLAAIASLKRRSASESLALERAAAIPDIKVGLGYRHIGETDTDTFVGSFSVELPLFSQNSNAVTGAKHLIDAAAMEEVDARRQLGLQVTRLQARLRSLVAQNQRVTNSLVPASKTAYRQARDAYEQGRIGYLELFDAMRTLFAVKKANLDLLLSLNSTAIELEQLFVVEEG